MSFNRYLGLAASVLLYVIILAVSFAHTHADIEGHFREERLTSGVDGNILIAANPSPGNPAASVPATPDATPTLAPSTDSNALIGPVPPPDAAAPSSTDLTPGTQPAAPDTTPVLPAPADPGVATPAMTPSDTPPALPEAPSDQGPAAPATPAVPTVDPANPHPTLNYPSRHSPSPFFVLTAYHPSDAAVVNVPDMELAQITPRQDSPTNFDLSPPPVITYPLQPGSLTIPKPIPGTTPQPTSQVLRPVPVPASVIVLGYHQFVGPGVASSNIYVMRQDVFDAEMKYLKDNNYHIVPLSDVIRFIKHEIGLPPNSVAITIDDGYKSSIVWAAPVLKKYGFPWTFFVYPSFITVAEGKGAASWNDLLALQADGVDIECHSMTHPQLAKKGGKTPEEYDAWLTNETATAKAILEQKLGKHITCFAYPYGEYNTEVENKVIAAGFEGIFTVAGNPVHPTTDIHSIGRYVITQPEEKNFVTYLHQGALGLAEQSPAPGTTITDPRPVISAVLGYAGNLDLKSIATEVRNFGVVRHDYDPRTSTVRLYLPSNLVQDTYLVSVRVKDADSGQTMVANWRFNYAPPAGSAPVHPPLTPGTKDVPVPMKTVPPTAAKTASTAGTKGHGTQP